MAKVKLGEIAFERKESCKGDKSKYPIVGLEHIIPEDINLKQWDEEKENTFSKLFYEGDILFGRRRAYLKKACVAPFEGICSGDITVISAIDGKVEPSLLPFIIQNDELFDFAVGKSAGSLSPRVKWENLKNFEIDLPDLEEQKHLAEVLWSFVEARDANERLLKATDELVKSQFIEMFGEPIAKEKDTELSELGQICTLKAGKFIKADDIKEKQEAGLFPCFGGNGIRGYVPSFNQEGEHPLVGRQGALCGNVQFASGQFYATEHAVVVTPHDDSIDTLWLYYLLVQLKLDRYATGAAQPGIAVNKLERIRVEIPDIEQQRKYARFARQSDKSKFELQGNISNLVGLQKRLLKETILKD